MPEWAVEARAGGVLFTPRATRGLFSAEATSRDVARVPASVINRQDNSEGEFSRAGDEECGG